MPATKTRLDALLVARGYFADTASAARAILAGDVRSPNGVDLKPGLAVPEDIDLVVSTQKPYVSRGGLKLEAALNEFGIDAIGFRCIDIGAGSGGFTDCLLQHGAASVTAIDVGYGQFDWKLRQDSRVTLMERTNFRTMELTELIGTFDLAVVDLSFIRSSNLLARIASCLKPEGQMIVLVKPQFELSDRMAHTSDADALGELGYADGVVSDHRLHEQVLVGFLARANALGLVVRGLIPSPVSGIQGNREFLFWASLAGEGVTIDVKKVVEV